MISLKVLQTAAEFNNFVESIKMSGEKVAKRQKISHGSDSLSAPSKSKGKRVEAESPSASSDSNGNSESEGSDNEQTQTAAEDAPKTFKDLVRMNFSLYAVAWMPSNPQDRAW